MVTAILLIIGFLVTGGAFGASLIGAFSLAQYWLWFAAIVATLIGAFIVIGGAILGGTTAAENRFSKAGVSLGAVGGGLLGSIVAGAIVLFTYVQLWLSYYIIEHIDPLAESFSAIGQDAQYGVYGFLTVMIVSLLQTARTKAKK